MEIHINVNLVETPFISSSNKKQAPEKQGSTDQRHVIYHMSKELSTSLSTEKLVLPLLQWHDCHAEKMSNKHVLWSD